MEWFSMDSAPKDGRLFVGWIGSVEFPSIAQWGGGLGWISQDGRKIKLTAWAPIVRPPEWAMRGEEDE